MEIRPVLGVFVGSLLPAQVAAFEFLCKSFFLPCFSLSLRAVFTVQGFEIASLTQQQYLYWYKNTFPGNKVPHPGSMSI